MNYSVRVFYLPTCVYHLTPSKRLNRRGWNFMCIIQWVPRWVENIIRHARWRCWYLYMKTTLLYYDMKTTVFRCFNISSLSLIFRLPQWMHSMCKNRRILKFWSQEHWLWHSPGRALGCSLFLVYILCTTNDLCSLNIPNGLKISYADEKALKCSITSRSKVFNWLYQNLLTLNTDKTFFLQWQVYLHLAAIHSLTVNVPSLHK